MARLFWRLIRLPWAIGREFFAQRRARRRREGRYGPARRVGRRR